MKEIKTLNELRKLTREDVERMSDEETTEALANLIAAAVKERDEGTLARAEWLLVLAERNPEMLKREDGWENTKLRHAIYNRLDLLDVKALQAVYVHTLAAHADQMKRRRNYRL